MSRILFIWELGEGNGHIMPYVDLVKRLLDEGHEVHFAFRSLHSVYPLFKESKLVWHQAPFILPRYVDVQLPVNTYAKVLHHAGYDNPERLAALIVAWKNLFQMIDPDLMVFDYSPTAMLAARTHRAKTLVTGTGYEIPPSTSPVQPLDFGSGNLPDLGEMAAYEENLLKTVNEALDICGIEPLEYLAQLLEADESILRTLPELDYYTREKGEYAGILPSPKGQAPEWPDFAGPKVFAYLKKFDTLPDLLGALRQKRYPTLIYGDSIKSEMMKRFESDTLRFVNKPLDMKLVSESADVAITNAGHGTTAELLLNGVPQLLLPLNGEQTVMGNNVEKIGAGLSAPKLHPQAMVHKLDLLITDPQYKSAARSFADSYQGKGAENLTDTILGKVNNLLNQE